MGKKMIKLACALVLISTFNKVYAMENMITLASQQELKKRLCIDIGVSHFVETTYIDRKLGSRKIHPFEITAILDMSLQQYNNNFENQSLHNKRQEIINAILQEYPETIEFLKNSSLEQKK